MATITRACRCTPSQPIWVLFAHISYYYCRPRSDVVFYSFLDGFRGNDLSFDAYPRRGGSYNFIYPRWDRFPHNSSARHAPTITIVLWVPNTRGHIICMRSEVEKNKNPANSAGFFRGLSPSGCLCTYYTWERRSRWIIALPKTVLHGTRFIVYLTFRIDYSIYTPV